MAERLKLHFGKALHQNRNKEPTQLRESLQATLEHEFGDHRKCSEQWCRHLKAKTDDERKELKTRWMNKEDNAVLYKVLNAVYEDFLTPSKITQMHHEYNTQKNEALNMKIARTCPKTMTFCKSMVLADRVDWVVIEDSLGGAAAIRAILEYLGIVDVPDTLLAYYTHNDKRRDQFRGYRAKKEVKHHRRIKLNEKIWADRASEEESRKRGQTYGAGVGFVGKKTSATAKKDTSAVRFCSACGQTTHFRRTHQLCPMNKKLQGTMVTPTINPNPQKEPPTLTKTPQTPATAMTATLNKSVDRSGG